MSLVNILFGRVWHACHRTAGTGLPGEIGRLRQLQQLQLYSNQLQGKYV